MGMNPDAQAEQGREELLALVASRLFLQSSELEPRTPVVILQHEKSNVYHTLEKHVAPQFLLQQERWWKAVRQMSSPALETWRPRVNGVQLKALQGARLPETEEEWRALEAGLAPAARFLRSDTSVARLCCELRDFVQLLQLWWANRKRGEGGPGSKRQAPPLAAPIAKRPSIDPKGMVVGPIFVQPEIISHSLLAPSPPLLCPLGPTPSRLHSLPLSLPASHYGPHVELVELLGDDLGTVQPLAPASHHERQAAAVAAQARSPCAAATVTAQEQQQQQHAPELRHHASPGRDALLPHPPPDRASSGCLPSPQRTPAAAAERQPSLPQHLAPLDTLGPVVLLEEPAVPSPREEQAAAAAPQPDLDRAFVSLNVGGHRFLTTAATLAVAEGSFLWKLAQQAAPATAGGCGAQRADKAPEFFVDRSGKLFEYVLDYLRSARFGERDSCLPRDERTLGLLRREAEFYQLPGLAEKAAVALMAAQDAAAAAAMARQQAGCGAVAPDASSPRALSGPGGEGESSGGPGGMLVDAVYLETGFQPSGSLSMAQANLLQQLNYTLQSRQADGFAITKQECGSEREGQLRNLFYHVMLKKAL